MPAEQLRGKDVFLARDQVLGDEEIVRVVRAFSRLGVAKVRLTGGEPLLRPGLCALIERISAIEGVRELSMTSNGVLLPRLAGRLRDAGLNRITVSLDSLDEAVFARMTGGRASVARVMEGIEAAGSAGFEQLKINCVVKRGCNDHTVMALLEHFRGTGHIPRLIEYLDVGNSNDWRKSLVVPGHDWYQRIHDRWPLQSIPRRHPGETAQRFRYRDGQGEIGLINSITRPFCGHCSRARVTADGILYTCMFSADGTDLKPRLRDGPGQGRLSDLIRDTWHRRADRYSEIRHLSKNDGGARKCGPEMYRLGG
jgi:cyclic pyranopterin phosphate synthase